METPKKRKLHSEEKELEPLEHPFYSLWIRKLRTPHFHNPICLYKMKRELTANFNLETFLEMKSPHWCFEGNLNLRKFNALLTVGAGASPRKFISFEAAWEEYKKKMFFTENAKIMKKEEKVEIEIKEAYEKTRTGESAVPREKHKLLIEMKETYERKRLMVDSIFNVEKGIFPLNPGVLSRKEILEKLPHLIAAIVLATIIVIDGQCAPMEHRRVVDATRDEEGRFFLLPEMVHKTDGKRFSPSQS